MFKTGIKKGNTIDLLTRITPANLFTGVYEAYRGRKLGQAVKAQALFFARKVLEVKQVKMNHNALNQSMIAIDRKFSYVLSPGNLYMRKLLN